MSVVCAMKEPGVGVWIGCDTQATAGDRSVAGHLDKWVVNGNRAVGVCGSVSLLSVLSSEPDLLTVSDDPFNFYLTILKTLREIDVAVHQEDNKLDGWLTLVLDNTIWSIDPGGGCIPHKHLSLVASGSGQPFAEGAGYLATKLGWAPKAVMRTAIDTAIKFDTNCGGKPIIRCLK